MNSTVTDQLKQCGFADAGTTNFKNFIFNTMFIIYGGKLCHLLLHRLGQPRIVSEFIVSLLVGSVFRLKGQVQQVFTQLEFIVSSSYMFVLGLEMDPLSLLQSPGLEDSVAYAGIFSTTFLSVITFVLFCHQITGFGAAPSSDPRVLSILTIMYAASSAPIITRLLTDFKIDMSEFGQRAIRASLTNDTVCMLVMCVLLPLRGSEGNTSAVDLLKMAGYILVEILVVFLLVRQAIRWVNCRNPEGERMSIFHMLVIIAMTQTLCYASYFFHYDTKANAFLIGLLLPRQGKVSNFLIRKINSVLATFALPLYFSMANLQFNSKIWNEVAAEHGMRRYGWRTAWVNLVYIVLVSTIGKLSGTLAAARYFQLDWFEAVTLGVLMSTKGYIHMFFTFHCRKLFLVGENSALVLMVAGVLSVIFAAPMVSLMASHIQLKKAATQRLMGMQWYNPATKLCITVGLSGPQNVPAAANIVEILRGGATEGLAVNAIDMIQITEQTSDSLAKNSIDRLRNKIGEALGAFSKTVTLTRTLAHTILRDMPFHICRMAQEYSSILIVMPFHKMQLVDGSMDSGESGLRKVNQNVLKQAPCSVGILLDRGLGRTNTLSLPTSKLSVAVLFIGGPDDREALALAGCIAQHPSVELTIIRFLPNKEVMETVHGLEPWILNALIDEEQKVMTTDDDYVTVFYKKEIENKGLKYIEKHVADGEEAVEILKMAETKYHLFIVGKGKEEDAVLTQGMSDRAEFQELGPVGDALASSNFSVSASVLVIQQHQRSFQME